MSELIKNNDNRATIRWKLLTSVSALALTVSSIGIARAEDADRPLIWIELGGQAESISGQGESFAPAFLSAFSTSSILKEKVTPLQAQKPPKFSFGEKASITFQPEDSDWVFSGAIRIGRSSSQRHVDHQTSAVHYEKYVSGHPIPSARIFTKEKFADTHVYRAENHSIMDFMAGKDVGLGMFGLDGSSVLSGGVRFAQFSSRSSVDMRARPDIAWKYFPSAAAPTRFVASGALFHTYHATGIASRSFKGVGPSISWTGSALVAGNHDRGGLTFDWGVNAALLFGRQKARVSHHQTGRYWGGLQNFYTTAQVLPPTAGGHTLNRSVTVPNVGGFAGLSYRYSNAKISFGYRYDTFLKATDTGIDARKTSNLTFNGPYASISFGLGD